MSNSSMKMRVYHRYLGFFLVGIMSVYAISGIILIFRDTDFLKQEHIETTTLPLDTDVQKLGEILRVRRFKIDKEVGDMVYFRNGSYDRSTGVATVTSKSLPYVLEKMTKMHKATSSTPLFFLNIFFGLALLFFVLSSFWMFLPGTSVFRKGVYFALGGLLFAMLVIFI